jgi:hypothetical protein
VSAIVHRVPPDDCYDHEQDDTGDCLCGPSKTPVQKHDGERYLLIRHRPLRKPRDSEVTW